MEYIVVLLYHLYAKLFFYNQTFQDLKLIVLYILKLFCFVNIVHVISAKI